jgi:voltage-gated potassium channel
MAGQSSDVLSRRLAWVGVALVIVVTYGVVGYMVLEGWSFFDALYMTVTTMTTVGFREVQEMDTGGRVFTLTVVVLGVAVALVGISLASALIAETELAGVGRRRRMEKRIETLQDHFIVCAYGRVGRAAVRELKSAGVPFVVLDTQEELRERMEADGVPFLVEDPSLEPTLRKAGVDRARALICAVDSDATNVYITLTARSLNPSLFIVARASEPGSAQRLERAGADRIVSPFVSSGRHMVRMARDPAIVDLFDEGSGGEHSIDVEERLIEADSPLIGMRVAEVPGAVLAIRRVGGRVEPSPPGDLRLADGDVVLLLPEVPAPD